MLSLREVGWTALCWMLGVVFLACFQVGCRRCVREEVVVVRSSGAEFLMVQCAEWAFTDWKGSPWTGNGRAK